MPLRDRIVYGEVRDAGCYRAGELLGLADHIPQNKNLVAANAAALRLQCTHDAIATVDPCDDLVGPLSDRVPDARLDVVVELREPAVELGQDIGVAHPA